MDERFSEMRRSYRGASLSESELAADWLTQLRRWLDEAARAGLPEPNAMVLATAGADGVPGGRTVLLKEADERGLAFFTNLRSRKGRELGENPRATLVFPWHAMKRQVVIDGLVEPLAPEESDAYFASRPRGARLGALASPQSQPIAGREELERRYAELDAAHPGGVPRPEWWGGLRVVPDVVEFWQGRPDRLHDRLRFRRAGEWVVERLAP
ncbi:MAG TPA: pyridoxamine 5'-phosphate oxidase [Thermoleophilaceae bacterium]|nr:pyridoxamine 5'-phosphate oxidase [Thermoleophilaceae bacterium]